MPEFLYYAATYYGAELIAAEVTKAFVIGLANSGMSVTFLRAAIYAGSFVVTSKIAQKLGVYGNNANELKGQTINVRSSTAPRQLIYGQSLVGGVMFYAATTGSTNEYLHTVFGLADHQIQSVEKVYFGDEDVGTVSGNVASGRYSGKARIQNSLTGGTAYADLVTETAALTNKWTSSHKLTGISSVYVRLQYDTSIYTSIPSIRALVKGKLVYDPRTTTTAWSDNPALCIRDYIMSEYGMRVTSDEIDSTSFIAAANICDETVTAKTAVTQKRYTLNGVVDTSKSPREVLQDMLSTCAGMLIYSSGKYKLIVGAFSNSVQTITADDLRSDIQISCDTEKANLFNRVSGVFADADKLYSATEYPAIASNSYKAEDGGEELTAQLDLNFTTNVLEAERLAKINLLKSRQGIVVNISCKPTCLNITAGDVVALTIAQLGWSGKYFRVMEWKLNEDIGVDLVLKEEDSTAYDWLTSDAIDGAPNTSLTLIQPQAAPTGLTATNQNLSFPDGTILPGVRIAWTALASAYVTGYELQFKLSTDTLFQSIFTTQTVYDIAGQQQVALQYNIKVRAIFSDKEGPFSTTINHTLSGDTTAPAAPTSLTAVGAYKTIQLSWTNPTVADWFYNEIWENSANDSATATKIGTVSSSTFARSGLGASVTKYYFLKAVDFSGNVSGFSTVASATTDAQVTDGTNGTNGTNGSTGATGPRNAQIYFFYDISQSTAPTAPSKAHLSYDFDTLTPQISATNWSTVFTPSALTTTTASNKYWAIKVIFQEATFGGSISEELSAVFTWQNMNGLVTFTNLANAVGSAGSATTFIDGGSITANTLTVSKIKDNSSSTFNTYVTFGLGVGTTIATYTAGGAFSSTDTGYFGLLARNTDAGYAIGGGSKNTANVDIGGIVAVGAGNTAFSTYRNAAYLGNGTSGGTFKTGGADNIQTAVTAEVRLAYYNGSTSYSAYLVSGSTYPFTAGHDALQLLTEDVPELGDIMVDVEMISAPNINDCITKMSKSTTANQKGAVGVYAMLCGNEFVPSSLGGYVNDSSEQNNKFVLRPEFVNVYETYRPIGVNAIGEGKINVCGQGGDIQIGDFIVTSDMAGKGMKQADDIARSYTVAKARENVTFANATDTKQIACIYICG